MTITIAMLIMYTIFAIYHGIKAIETHQQVIQTREIYYKHLYHLLITTISIFVIYILILTIIL